MCQVSTTCVLIELILPKLSTVKLWKLLFLASGWLVVSERLARMPGCSASRQPSTNKADMIHVFYVTGRIIGTSANLQTNPKCEHSRCYNHLQATKINQVGLAIATSSSLRAFSPRHSRALRTKLQKKDITSHCRFLGDLSILCKRLQPTNTSPQWEAQRQDRRGVHLPHIGVPRLKSCWGKLSVCLHFLRSTS